jgi:hypothetical protein
MLRVEDVITWMDTARQRRGTWRLLGGEEFIEDRETETRGSTVRTKLTMMIL